MIYYVQNDLYTVQGVTRTYLLGHVVLSCLFWRTFTPDYVWECPMSFAESLAHTLHNFRISILRQSVFEVLNHTMVPQLYSTLVLEVSSSRVYFPTITAAYMKHLCMHYRWFIFFYYSHVLNLVRWFWWCCIATALIYLQAWIGPAPWDIDFKEVENKSLEKEM